MEDKEIIHLRPHHMLCSQFFVGKGYSEDFARNMGAILDKLNRENLVVQFVEHCDEICSRCPRRTGDVCEDEEHVMCHDNFCLEEYGVSVSDNLTWEEIRAAVLGKIRADGRLPAVCDGCRWRTLCADEPRHVLFR